ncbi:hypothetical protein SAMD00019534_021780, partial [Acytostelium subglobosum LB1]|uniref:hypothetical protein n=1 Tax=Acytostelium subglobosum LB1 TaxID=1410327 RepID=UPI000644DAD6
MNNIRFLIFCMVIIMVTYFLPDEPTGDKLKAQMPLGLDATFKTVPSFYNRQDQDQYDFAIATHVTVDQLERLAWISDKWRAPISAAIYVHNDTDVSKIVSLIRSSYSVTQFVDVHLLYSNNTRYPVNSLRNLAVQNAESEWVLMMDVDYLPPIYLYQNLESYAEKIPKDQMTGIAMASFSSSLGRFDLPNDKSELIDLISSRKINSKTKECLKCHSATNYSRWYTEKDPYETTYKWTYEPVLAIRKSQAVKFDERFKGIGYDIIGNTFALAAKGFNYVVLPEAWVVHVKTVTTASATSTTLPKQQQKQQQHSSPQIDLQQRDSLKILCDSFSTARTKAGKDNTSLFGEPLHDA